LRRALALKSAAGDQADVPHSSTGGVRCVGHHKVLARRDLDLLDLLRVRKLELGPVLASPQDDALCMMMTRKRQRQQVVCKTRPRMSSGAAYLALMVGRQVGSTRRPSDAPFETISELLKYHDRNPQGREATTASSLLVIGRNRIKSATESATYGTTVDRIGPAERLVPEELSIFVVADGEVLVHGSRIGEPPDRVALFEHDKYVRA